MYWEFCDFFGLLQLRRNRKSSGAKLIVHPFLLRRTGKLAQWKSKKITINSTTMAANKARRLWRESSVPKEPDI